jgi:hypothetical protein
MFRTLTNSQSAETEGEAVMNSAVVAPPSGPFEAAAAAPTQAYVDDFDASRYLGDLEGMDITEAQKRELLGVLWCIMRSFVEMGLDVNRCGQLLPLLSESGQPDVRCTFTTTETLSTAPETDDL